MNTDTLARFLNEANKATYANKSAPRVASSRLKSKDYHFEKDGLAYHDTYFGERNFIGEEIVYENEKPIWGANYFGFMLNESINEKEVYDFLRLALMRECNDLIPVRGSANFSAENKEYHFVVNGDLSNFSGAEEILFNQKVVYRCLIQGGMIR